MGFRGRGLAFTWNTHGKAPGLETRNRISSGPWIYAIFEPVIKRKQKKPVRMSTSIVGSVSEVYLGWSTASTRQVLQGLKWVLWAMAEPRRILNSKLRNTGLSPWVTGWQYPSVMTCLMDGVHIHSCLCGESQHFAWSCVISFLSLLCKSSYWKTRDWYGISPVMDLTWFFMDVFILSKHGDHNHHTHARDYIVVLEMTPGVRLPGFEAWLLITLDISSNPSLAPCPHILNGEGHTSHIRRELRG